jgi:hypothetical protein
LGTFIVNTNLIELPMVAINKIPTNNIV